VYVYAFSLRRESFDIILRDKPLISEVILSQLSTVRFDLDREVVELERCEVIKPRKIPYLYN
jgi:hypothetical protein